MKFFGIFILLILSSCAPSNITQNKETSSMPANSSSKFNDLLNKAVKGKQYNTVAETGLNQEFIVSEEYYSASGKECKRFVFNQKAFAACKEGVMWFGVRVF